MTTLLDLPGDIILLILNNVQPQSYLNFCQITKAFYQEYRHQASYWRVQTAQKFRLPISPLLHADGPRWFWLYRKLKTQTRLYTWGKGVKGNLGPARSVPARRLRGHPIGGHRLLPRSLHPRTTSQWPTETDIPDHLGTIVDLQCGGWSTTVLTTDGRAYTLGIINSADGRNVGEVVNDFTRLDYLSQSTTALQQISVGRRHVLALDDNGEIITWDRINAKGYKVFAREGRDFGGIPRRVVAGWGDSSAYVPEVGIVYWPPVENNQADQMLDGVHVKQKVIPNTARRRLEQTSERDEWVEVLTHIVLEGWVVYITNQSKVFACSLESAEPESNEPRYPSFEVPGYAHEDRQVKDIQGSFRSFAVFTSTGDVLAGDIDYLRRCSVVAQNNTRGEQDVQTLVHSRPADIPALQHTGVIGLAFGDWHYHALHADGTLSSFGTELGCCGSLGLGDVSAGAWFRGVEQVSQAFRGADAKLLPSAEKRGRQVWFEPEKKDWLRWMQDHNVPGSPAYFNFPDQRIYSEWVEQEGRHWADGPFNVQDSLANEVSEGSKQQPRQPDEARSYDNLGAYFAISVAAAGWHSGALVLVDEEKAEEVGKKWTVSRPAPAIPGEFEQSGEVHEEYVWEMQTPTVIQVPPGTLYSANGTPQPWRDGIPSREELGLT